MNWANIGWWVAYACIAIVLQSRAPGLDFMLPGFILAIQERNGAQFLWVAVFFLLLQEGMGNMAFGGTLLWYALAVFLFRLGHNLFEAESFLFIFLLSGCLGVTHYLVFSIMAGLQGIPVHPQTLMDESVFQALFTPFLWRLAHYSRRFIHREDRA